MLKRIEFERSTMWHLCEPEEDSCDGMVSWRYSNRGNASLNSIASAIIYCVNCKEFQACTNAFLIMDRNRRVRASR